VPRTKPRKAPRSKVEHSISDNYLRVRCNRHATSVRLFRGYRLSSPLRLKTKRKTSTTDSSSSSTRLGQMCCRAFSTAFQPALSAVCPARQAILLEACLAYQMHCLRDCPRT
jgi:hypothetical protein